MVSLLQNNKTYYTYINNKKIAIFILHRVLNTRTTHRVYYKSNLQKNTCREKLKEIYFLLSICPRMTQLLVYIDLPI